MHNRDFFLLPVANKETNKKTTFLDWAGYARFVTMRRIKELDVSQKISSFTARSVGGEMFLIKVTVVVIVSWLRWQ